MTMTFLDFFAGIGGFRRGMELAGHKCLGFCEYDKFAVQSYRAIHNTEGEWYAKDIRTVRADDLPRADIWCAGFPCQDVSIAGKCLGFRGKRSSLFFAVTGLIRNLEEKDRPSYLFFENVKNLYSVNGGFDFARIQIELDEIGYDVEWSLINSADVVPQNRERVFIVGRLRGGRGRKVFPVGKSGKPSAELQRFTAGTITARTGGAATVGTYVAERQQYAQEMIYQRSRGNNSGGLHDVAPTVTSNCYEHNNLLVKTINISDDNGKERPQQDRIYDISGHMTALSSQLNGRYNITVPCLTPDRVTKRQNGRRFKNNNDPMFTLTAQDRHGVVTGGIYTGVSLEYQSGPLAEKSCCLKSNKTDAGVMIYQKPHGYNKGGLHSQAPSLTSSSYEHNNVVISQNAFRIRKLTPLECWRLQGWDDESFFRAFFLDKDLAHKFNKAYQRHKNRPVRLIRWAFGHQKMSDSQLYKQAGNGVTVPVIQRIAEKFSLEEHI